MRADPPGLAGEGPRRRVFGAALGQWDALWLASRRVEPAASPILLFYALSQATRALCAARIREQYWNPQRHGLSVTGGMEPLGSTVVTPDGSEVNSFGLLCAAIGSPVLTGTTTLGALWAANPHTASVVGLGAENRPVLQLNQIGPGDWYIRANLVGEPVENLPPEIPEAQVELRRRLADAYPGTAEGLAVESAPARDGDGRVSVQIAWRTADGRPRALSDIAPGLTDGRSGAYLRPALNDNGDVLTFLPLFWATLLALSSLARYSPDRWTAALARDRSKLAIPLEEAREHARVAALHGPARAQE